VHDQALEDVCGLVDNDVLQNPDTLSGPVINRSAFLKSKVGTGWPSSAVLVPACFPCSLITTPDTVGLLLVAVFLEWWFSCSEVAALASLPVLLPQERDAATKPWSTCPGRAIRPRRLNPAGHGGEPTA
jgi:hypothetical protein